MKRIWGERVAGLLVALGLVTVAVAPGPASAGAAQGAPGREWTAGIVDRAAGGMSTLRDVRVARHAGYDRVVFEFSGPIPGYHLEYVDSPVRQCGSGEPTPIAGDGWLEVRLSPAQAHTDAGKATVGWRERRLRLPVLREIERTCDFEGVVTWVLGVRSPNRYRVMELSCPSRLVVDVKH